MNAQRLPNLGRLALSSAAVLCATWCAAADIMLTAEQKEMSVTSGDVFVLKADVKGSADVALKVYDGAGKLVRVLSGKHLHDAKVEIPWNMKDDQKQPVKPGVYTVRLESGWSLALDRKFGEQGMVAGPPFVSPRDLAVDRSGNLYVLDGGAAVLYKYRPDGSPANDIDGQNKLAAPEAPYWDSVAVGPDGRIYLPWTHTSMHIIGVYDGKTGEQVAAIGGYFEDDPGWKTTKGGFAYPALVRLNGETRMYVTSPGYGTVYCFDPRQQAKAGGQWLAGSLAQTPKVWIGPGDAGCTDGKNALYLVSADSDQRAHLLKLVDTGTTADGIGIAGEYYDAQLDKPEPLRDIGGVAWAGAGDLYAVLRGAAKIVKFVDNGLNVEGIASLGAKGKDAAKLEFMAPTAIVASPDGKALYIAEAGEKNGDKDTTPGLARVTKYTLSHAVRKELALTVKP